MRGLARLGACLAGLATGSLLLGSLRVARADLASDAQDLARTWSAAGYRASQLGPMFLEHGRPRAVHLPQQAFPTDKGLCTTVAVLSGRGTDFVARIEPITPVKGHPFGGRVERSIAGAVLLSECGAAREAFERLAVEVQVVRAAVEVVVATGDNGAPSIAEMLPERASGPVASPAEAGLRGPPEALAERVRRAEERARSMEVGEVRMQTLTADSEGTGHEQLRLDEGCHRVELFADLLGQRPVDVDAELRESSTERLVARDRSDAVDARLDLCAGSTMGAGLLFAGAPGAVQVVLLDEVFPIPRGIPVQWGARARAGLAAALWRRRAPPVERDPIEQRLGVSGVTIFPLSVEPGACYLAAVAVQRGDARSITLRAQSDNQAVFDSNAGLIDNAAVAFCSVEAAQAYFEVEVRGGTAGWILSLWRMGSRPASEDR